MHGAAFGANRNGRRRFCNQVVRLKPGIEEHSQGMA